MNRTTLLLALACLAAPALAGTLAVPGTYPTIQAAVDAAGEGDTVLVSPGTYHENVVIGVDLLLRSVGGPAVTVIDGGGLGDAVSALQGSGVEGFTLTGGATGLRISTGDTTHVTDCDFLGNSGWGLWIDSFQFGFLVADCRFLGNGAGGARLSVALSGGIVAADVRRCIFTGGDGVLFEQTANAANGVAFKCSFDGGDVQSEGALVVRNSIVRGGSLSAWSTPTVTYSNIEGGAAGPGNIDANPLWSNPGALDYALLPGSPCINSGNPSLDLDADGSISDMGAVPYDPWAELGGGVAGAAGLATLAGDGPMTSGAAVSIALDGALPGAGVFLVLGGSALGAPAKGGTFWPAPDLILGPFAADGAGDLAFGGVLPAGLPAGFAIWSQCWWLDAGAAKGWGASNGLSGTTP
jgi:hypothetical protein